MALGREREAQMTYHFSKTVNMRFDDAVASTKEALKRHNFRVITEIDMKDNFKKGLNINFRPYLILGACNPQLTYRALQAEDKIGTMLPCNIVLQQQENGRVEVSAVDPVASMQAITHVVCLRCICSCPRVVMRRPLAECLGSLLSHRDRWREGERSLFSNIFAETKSTRIARSGVEVTMSNSQRT